MRRYTELQMNRLAVDIQRREGEGETETDREKRTGAEKKHALSSCYYIHEHS